MDPHEQWMPTFQTALLLRHEQVLRERVAEWLLVQCGTHPKIYPEKRDRLVMALANATE